jgi:Ca2+-binding EF-hand superfamily protein
LIKVYPANESEERLRQILTDIDFNNDGKISFSEFTALTIKHDALLSEEKLRKAFESFDLVNN